MSANLYDLIDPSADGDALISVDTDGCESRLTYSRFRARCWSIAAYLTARNLPPGSTIGVLASNHADYMPTVFGIALAGCISCPINWKAGDEIIRFVAADADVRLVFADKDRRSVVPDGIPCLELGAELNAFSRKENRPVSATEIACIMYTSGSTGFPKGVPIGHAGYKWGVAQYQSSRPENGQGRILISAPLYHMNGQCDFLISLSHGTTSVVLRQFDVDLFLQCIERFSVTEIGGVPTMLAKAIDRMVESQPVDTSSVTSVNIGSAPLGARLASRILEFFPNCTITNGYGTTETGFVSFGAHPEGKERPLLSVGYPMPGVDFRIEGSRQEGELLLKTPMMARGYLNRPDETNTRFASGWYRTGDVVKRDDDGFFYIVGRVDDMFICGGENVFPAEVEQRLETHPALGQAAVVAVKDAIKGTVPFAFVVLLPGETVTEEDLKAYTIEVGPAYAHPRYIQFINALPLASTNKVDKAALTRRAAKIVRARKGR
ncbi:MAG: acyl--CoA ligase [Chromatiales bacterium]|nr:acyl--CoA ligase [Chromatiales bacterium]MYC52188.1 acyl--CoA ligase [Gammaproteobacteria bacterium]